MWVLNIWQFLQAPSVEIIQGYFINYIRLLKEEQVYNSVTLHIKFHFPFRRFFRSIPAQSPERILEAFPTGILGERSGRIQWGIVTGNSAGIDERITEKIWKKWGETTGWIPRGILGTCRNRGIYTSNNSHWGLWKYLGWNFRNKYQEESVKTRQLKFPKESFQDILKQSRLKSM